MQGQHTSVIAGHRMPERFESRAETGGKGLVSLRRIALNRSVIETLLRQERGGTYDAMSGEGPVIADTLK